VLFIANGSGHNPIVVTETADVDSAVASALSVQLYNQGQDCANPNAILCSCPMYEEFVSRLRSRRQGSQGWTLRGQGKFGRPISKRKDLKTIQALLVDNAEWLDRRRTVHPFQVVDCGTDHRLEALERAVTTQTTSPLSFSCSVRLTTMT